MQGVKLILHEFGTCKIDFLYIRYYLAAKIDFMRKPILAAPDPQTKMGCPRIDSKTMMATARRATNGQRRDRIRRRQ
jgi:hypothetical protein